ncbi:MAG: hypothetical protein Q9212_000051 [Teloschistes hypoglaucus]
MVTTRATLAIPTPLQELQEDHVALNTATAARRVTIVELVANPPLALVAVPNLYRLIPTSAAPAMGTTSASAVFAVLRTGGVATRPTTALPAVNRALETAPQRPLLGMAVGMALAALSSVTNCVLAASAAPLPYGYCGTTAEYCTDPDCQFAFGTCDSSHTPAGPTTLNDPRPLLGQVTYDNDIYDCAQNNVVALTYDDGPYLYTSQLLDILKSYGFKATFFMTGNNLHKGPIDETAPYPDLIKRMVAEGHQVASHTWSHYSLSNIPSDVRKQQMVKNERAIANIIGKYPTYMRPPYSQCNQASGCWADMKALGYHRVYFDLDTQDYLNPNTIQNSKNIVKQILATPGTTDYLSIQHDIVQQSVTNLTYYYFDLIKNKGWKGVTAGECLNDAPANWYRTPGGSGATPISPSTSIITSKTTATTSRTTSKASTTTPKSTAAAPTPTSGPECVVQAVPATSMEFEPGTLMSSTSFFRLALIVGLALVGKAASHEHHDDKIPEGEAISPDPIDTTLWIHIIVQIVAFGLIFPTGMVLGIVRSRWHVPLQTLGAIIALLGYFLGHAHGGRQFAHNIHASFATILMLLLLVQVLFGIYLKLHLEKKSQNTIHARIRRYFVLTHGVIGKVMPVVSWVQMLFGGITALGFCRDDHLGQCLAHFIMGSAFIGYGILLTILLLVGQAWLQRTGRSQEFFDSLIIAAWGCVNTFTEHRWGGPWVKNDLQHTSMGIVWWCAGLLGLWLSRKRDGRPKRNLIPAMVILITGWAMSAHPQSLELSTHVHAVFGYTLMAAGAARIIEIAFILRDRGSVDEEGKGDEASSWQYLTPFLLHASGLLFMGATEEQMAFLTNAHIHVSHVSYILILYSIAFLLFLFVTMLLNLYAAHAWPTNQPVVMKNAGSGVANGAIPLTNGHIDRRMRDAEEFELEGLMSDDEDDNDVGNKDGRGGKGVKHSQST